MKNEQTKPVKVVRSTKTHHQTGYHKPVKNPTTNYPKDSHKEFCKRCLAHNGVCPRTNGKPSKACDL